MILTTRLRTAGPASNWPGTAVCDLSHLPDGAEFVFICSGVEDPERKPAV